MKVTKETVERDFSKQINQILKHFRKQLSILFFSLFSSLHQFKEFNELHKLNELYKLKDFFKDN